MANSTKSSKISKKTIKLEIVKRLEDTFSDLEKALGKRRFRRNIKKAGKALTSQLKDIAAPPASKKIATAKEPEVKVQPIEAPQEH